MTACRVCGRPAHAWGLCTRHYLSEKKYGDPTVAKERPPRGISPRELFLWYVRQKDGCWEWTGAKNRAGYGVMNHRYGSRLAHRVSYQLHYGKAPDGMEVCHSCDNPECTNPEHLFLGTRADNAADSSAKGRSVRGERIRNAKLTEPDVRAIRASSDPQPVLAERYGVSQPTISDIHTRRTWAHLK